MTFRATNARDAYAAYLVAYRGFIEVTEACVQKGWPDFRSIIHDAFRSQYLCIERDLTRLHSLAARDPNTLAALADLSAISARLGAKWTNEDNSAIAAQDGHYQCLEAEIERLLAIIGNADLKGPFRDVKRDPEYIRAIKALQEEAVRIEAGLLARE